MNAYIILLIIIPSATALVDCRTACRSCRSHDEGIDANALEVFCTMCQECKVRHKQQRLQRQNTVAGSKKEGVTVQWLNPALDPVQCIRVLVLIITVAIQRWIRSLNCYQINLSRPSFIHIPGWKIPDPFSFYSTKERMRSQVNLQFSPNPEQNQMQPNVQRNQFLPIEVPPQLPPNPEPIEHYAEALDIPEGCPTPPPCDYEVITPYKTKLLAISTEPTTTTTITTSTTTTRPCPTFKPCRPTTVRPSYIFIPPPQMILLPHMPVQSCYMQPMSPIQPYPAYHYAPAPMPYAQGPMHRGFMKSYCPLTEGQSQNNKSPEKSPREEVIVNQSDQQQYFTGKAPGSGEDFGTDVTKKTRIPSVRKNLPFELNFESKKNKDFVYVYIGVPKQVLQD